MTALRPFFSHTDDSGLGIRGYKLRSTDQAYADTEQDIFCGLEDISIFASFQTRLFACFRFVSSAVGWGTAWRKHKGDDCIDVDLVFLFDVDLPFYGCNLAKLSPGLQRLVIGLATRDVFADVIYDCAAKFLAWGHDPTQISKSLNQWFEREGYTNIETIFFNFERDASLSECDGVIRWLEFDDIVFLYESFLVRRSEFTTRLDSRFHYEKIGMKPKNKKLRNPR